jgi:hypothetical protein
MQKAEGRRQNDGGSAFRLLHFTAYGKEKAGDAVLPGRAEVPVALKTE